MAVAPTRSCITSFIWFSSNPAAFAKSLILPSFAALNKLKNLLASWNLAAKLANDLPDNGSPDSAGSMEKLLILFKTALPNLVPPSGGIKKFIPKSYLRSTFKIWSFLPVKMYSYALFISLLWTLLCISLSVFYSSSFS